MTFINGAMAHAPYDPAWREEHLNVATFPGHRANGRNSARPYVGVPVRRADFVRLGIPFEEQGRLTGNLAALQGGLFIVLLGVVGAVSDRIGRRTVYVFDLLTTALGVRATGIEDRISGRGRLLGEFQRTLSSPRP